MQGQRLRVSVRAEVHPKVNICLEQELLNLPARTFAESEE